MKLLISGATGFVGRNLLLAALRRDDVAEILLPVRNPEKLRAQLAEEGYDALPEKLTPITGAAGTWRLGTAAEDITHAVLGAGLLFATRREDYETVNVRGTAHLLGQLPPHARKVLLSSQSATGPTPPETAARNETHAPTPVSLYGRSKLAMERAAMETAADNLVILRPPTVLGPRDTATLPLFRMVRSRIRVKPGLHTKVFSWIAVADLVDALWRVLDAERCREDTYFVTGDGLMTDRGLITAAAAAMERRGVTIPVPQPGVRLAAWLLSFHPGITHTLPSLSPDRVCEVWERRWVVDDARFRATLDWKPAATFADTLLETGRWYRRRGETL